VGDKNETKISKVYEANSMKQCPAEEASGSSACQKKSSILKNPEVHCRVQNRPALSLSGRTETCSLEIRNCNIVVIYGGLSIN
jgi:hypothetical protein